MNTTIDLSKRLRILDGVIFRPLDDGAVLLNLISKNYYSLNEIGADMWRILAQGASIEQAFDGLLAEYEVEPGVLRADLQRLVEELLEQGLVKIV